MGNFYGIDSETIEIFRRLGIGSIYAFFLIGASIFAARLVLRWQVRRFERLMARKEAEEAARKSASPDEHERPQA
jgi:hypothetical protein